MNTRIWTLALLLSPLLTRGQESTRSARPEYSAFRIIAERNIFNPTRSTRAAQTRERETRAPDRVESFALVGTLSYAKGPVAFFHGENSAHRKAIRAGESIADLKVVEIGPKAVTLQSGEKRIDLEVGTEMRRENGGDWKVGARGVKAASSEKSSPGQSSDSGGAVSDILKRLMEQREKETR